MLNACVCGWHCIIIARMAVIHHSENILIHAHSTSQAQQSTCIPIHTRTQQNGKQIMREIERRVVYTHSHTKRVHLERKMNNFSCLCVYGYVLVHIYISKQIFVRIHTWAKYAYLNEIHTHTSDSSHGKNGKKRRRRQRQRRRRNDSNENENGKTNQKQIFGGAEQRNSKRTCKREKEKLHKFVLAESFFHFFFVSKPILFVWHLNIVHK